MSEEQQPDPAPQRSRWRDRTWSLPVVVAVALVAVLLGGLGGAALASVGGQDDRRGGPGFGRMGGPGPGGPGFNQNRPRGPGQGQGQDGNGQRPSAPPSP